MGDCYGPNWTEHSLRIRRREFGGRHGGGFQGETAQLFPPGNSFRPLRRPTIS